VATQAKEAVIVGFLALGEGQDGLAYVFQSSAQNVGTLARFGLHHNLACLDHEGCGGMSAGMLKASRAELDKTFQHMNSRW
jgi:hypothetical protein